MDRSAGGRHLSHPMPSRLLEDHASLPPPPPQLVQRSVRFFFSLTPVRVFFGAEVSSDKAGKYVTLSRRVLFCTDCDTRLVSVAENV